MSTLRTLIKRNSKVFFKDKAMFFTSLITPCILLVLYITFLGKVYKDSFSSALPAGFTVSESLINGTVGAQLFSAILAVSCVTVSFCSNLIMVQDKISGASSDFRATPLNPSALSLSYYVSSAVVSLIICYTLTAACFIYIACVGWFFSASDILLILLDVFLIVMFGTSLSSIIYYFMSSNGQVQAVSTIISAGYGFLCGAYMPISQFGRGLQKVLAFLPGTYGTSLIRCHAMDGVFRAMESEGIPLAVIDGIKDSLDCNISFFENAVSNAAKYAVLIISTFAFIGVYVIIASGILSRKRSGKS